MSRNTRGNTKKKHRVYVTTLDNGEFYIGYSGKADSEYENYYGSNERVINAPNKTKETIAEYTRKSSAKMTEFLMQWENRHNPLCINDMINIRLRMSHLKDYSFTPYKIGK